MKGRKRTKIRKNDQVVLMAGRDKGKRGRVLSVAPARGKVKVEGAMIVKRHRKPVPQMNREGGIKEQEAWVNISNVAIVDPETGKPTKVRYEIQDGKKVRIAKSGKVIQENASYKREAKKTIEDEETEETKETK